MKYLILLSMVLSILFMETAQSKEMTWESVIEEKICTPKLNKLDEACSQKYKRCVEYLANRDHMKNTPKLVIAQSLWIAPQIRSACN